MIDLSSPYLMMGLLVYAINVVPALMPPTWLFLAFYFIHDRLEFIPVVVIGAIAATLGRITLSLLSKNYLRKYIPEKPKKNLTSLGRLIHANHRLTIPILVSYAFFPLPSNQIYIAAGLANMNIKVIAASFFFGRLISYTFWVSAAHKVFDRWEAIFSTHLTETGNIVVNIAGFGLLALISMVDWGKMVKRGKRSVVNRRPER